MEYSYKSGFVIHYVRVALASKYTVLASSTLTLQYSVMQDAWNSRAKQE